MIENTIFFVLLFVFNMVFVIKRIPIMAIPLSIFTFFAGATYYLPLGEFNALFSVMLMLVAGMTLLINVIYLRKK